MKKCSHNLIQISRVNEIYVKCECEACGAAIQVYSTAGSISVAEARAMLPERDITGSRRCQRCGALGHNKATCSVR